MEKVGKTNKVKINKILLQKCALSSKKSTTGITLIALIVTIIVLLILAGVTIATLTGDNRNFITSPECKYNQQNSRNRGASKFTIYRNANRPIIRKNK